MNININGETYDVGDEPNRLLLWVIRDELGLTGTKYGCGAGICGSCTVWINGVPTRSCITPLEDASNQEIRTIEGLAEHTPAGEIILHPVQKAFLEKQVPQCSWCMSGQMMTAAAFLEDNAQPDETEIIEAMSQNYCRCGCYVRIREAVAYAAELKAGVA